MRKLTLLLIVFCLYLSGYAQERTLKEILETCHATIPQSQQFNRAVTDIVALEKALKSDPDNLEILYALGMDYYIVGGKDKSYLKNSVKIWDTYIAKSPPKKAGSGYWNRSLAKFFMNDKAGFCEDLTQAKKLLKKKELKALGLEKLEKECPEK
jgi:hypothetical protein